MDCSAVSSDDLTFRICINNQQKNLCTIQKSGPNTCSRIEFPGRVTYLGSNRILIRNLTRSESGTLSCYAADKPDGQRERILYKAVIVGKHIYIKKRIGNLNVIKCPS